MKVMLCAGEASADKHAARVIEAIRRTNPQAEFFGLWGLAVKLASILGPLTYGVASWVTGNDHRQALLITGSYFVLGLIALDGIGPVRGRRAAHRFAAMT